MKLQWSAIFSLLLLFTLASCGEEQFGTVPQNTKSGADPIKSYAHQSCSTYTLIKPKVDVLYLVDNSGSTYYLSSDIKSALSNTVNKLSQDFDYRVIGTPLLETAGGNGDYQVMTNSVDLHGLPTDAKRISSAGSFNFFTKEPVSGTEKGLRRLVSFVDAHKNGLIRNNAYLIIVLVSNGRDLEIEEDAGFNNGQTIFNKTIYDEHLNKLKNDLKTSLNYIQLRLLSVTAKNVCGTGFRTAHQSYVKASQDLYIHAQASDNPTNLDSYDLCSSGGISQVFTAINNSIKQVVLPHEYRYWPITFASDPMVSTDDIRVQKISPTGASVTLQKNVDWTYDLRSSEVTIPSRELPTPGEPITGRHFIKFTNRVVYPDCVLVTSISRTEYFGYVVLPQKPKSPVLDNLTIRINGNIVPKSALTDETNVVKTINIKVDHPTGNPPGTANPPVMRTGYMIKLAPSHYYKSGDQVDVSYNPAGI
jgi:hypothetical protein